MNGEPDTWGARFRTTTSTTNLGAALKNIIWTGGGATEGFAVTGVGTGGAALEVRNDGIVWVKSSLRTPAVYQDYWYDSGGTFIARTGSGSGTTRHINLSNSTTDPSQASVDSGITWGQRTDSQPYYIIHPRNYNNGYFSGNHLQLAWHTGVDIGAASVYGGTRFFNNSPFTGTEIGSFGKSDNYLRADYGVLAPRYYDISNTGYYFDGLDGTNLQYLNVNGNWGSNPFGPGTPQLVVTGTYASIYQTSTRGNLGYMLQHMADDGAYYLYGGRGAVNGSSWDWSQRNFPNQDGSYVEFRTSARAPVFYDRDDTNYLLDPAVNGTALRIFGMARIGGWSGGNYNENIRLVDAGNAYSVITFGASGDAGVGRYQFLKNPSDILELRPVSQANVWYWDQSGIAWSNVSVRAPIFYDSADSTFRLDLNSSSRLRNLYVGDSGSDWVDEGGWGSQIHISNAPHSILRVYARSEGIQTGIYSHVGGLSAVGSFTNHNLRLLRNGATRMFLYSGYTYSEGYFEAADSLRAPLFYDSNDTGYYGDFASTSYFNVTGTNKMRADTNRAYGDNSGWWTHDPYGQGWGKPYGSFRSLEVSTSGNFSTEPAMFRIHQWGSGSCEWWKPQGTTVYLRETPGGGGSWFTRYVIERYAENTESFRAPIFYDSNNTGYYINPASFTEIYGGLRMSGGHGDTTIRNRLLAGNNGAGTGVVHMQWWCSEPGNTWDWGGFGYNVDQTYHDGSGPYYFSRPNTSFGSAYFRFSTAGNAYFYNTNSGGARNTTMEWYTDGTSYANNYLTGGNSLRAPIFYDSNDTSYYANPNGESSFSTGFFWGNRLVIRGGSPTLYFRDTDENSAMLHTNSNRLYVLRGGTDSESWGTVNGYWPTYWQLNTNYCLMGGTTEAVYDFRAPIFYDSNDTSYYYDGTANSRSADHRFSRIGFPGSGISGDGFPYARIVEAWGVAFAPSDARWAPNVYNASFLVGFYSSGTNFGSGNILATGNITAYYSDERLKNIISVIPNALDKVMTLRGFYYTNNELAKENGYTDEKVQLGVSAQEVEAVLPEIVTLAPFDMCGDNDPINGDGKLYSKSGQHYKTVDYSRLTPLLIEAMKELKGELDIARAEIKELKEAISKK